ncbi:CsbD family protein [Ideonella sp. DXS29W]|uniref:CsbD family protein n=1 Tax=Ideonella lacteola TaxID=2984193 RepID=A0ABU9BU25_9BURK
MNENQVKGSLKEVAGKVQRKTGELIDSPKQQVQGATREVAGKVQKQMGDVEENLKDAQKGER